LGTVPACDGQMDRQTEMLFGIHYNNITIQ